MRRMFDEKQLGGGGKEIIVLPSGTDIKTYNWADHEDGARFKGSNLLGIPEEITQTKNFVIELHKFDDKAFALTLYHTGLYNEHVGTYIIYHYSDKFQDNWTRIDKQESGGLNFKILYNPDVAASQTFTFPLSEENKKIAFDAKFIHVQFSIDLVPVDLLYAKKTTGWDTRVFSLNDNKRLFTGKIKITPDGVKVTDVYEIKFTDMTTANIVYESKGRVSFLEVM